TGICKSIKISLCFLGFSLVTASKPFTATSTSAPQRLKKDCATITFIALSSTNKMVIPAKGFPSSAGRDDECCGLDILVLLSNVWIKKKVETFPSSLTNCSEECCSSKILLEIARPKPVPPKPLEVEESACVNLSKIIFCFSLDIPIPVSVTCIFNLIIDS